MGGEGDTKGQGPLGAGKQDGKERVRQAMGSKASKKEKFVAFVNATLDNAKQMRDGGATKEQQDTAMEELRSSVDEIWEQIDGKR